MLWNKKTIIFLILPGILIAGCGGSKITTLQSFEKKLDSYDKMYFSAEPMVTDDIAQEAQDLEMYVLNKVKDSSFFDTVLLGICETECNNTLNVKAVITDIKKVSGTARFFGGAFTGKARMVADVYFFDALTGDTLGIYNTSGKSGGTGMSGGTEAAIKRSGDMIAEIIFDNIR